MAGLDVEVFLMPNTLRQYIGGDVSDPTLPEVFLSTTET